MASAKNVVKLVKEYKPLIEITFTREEAIELLEALRFSPCRVGGAICSELELIGVMAR